MDKNTLKAAWSKKENDFLIHFPRSCDGSLLNDYLFHHHYWFDQERKKSLKDELEERGYDLKTLKFSIKKLSQSVQEANK